MGMPGPKTSLVLQRVTETSDSMGGMTSTWADVITLTGVLTAGSSTSARFIGKERTLSDKTTVASTLIFFCDVPTGITITEKDRFSYGSRKFDILFIYNPGQMGNHLEIALYETT